MAETTALRCSASCVIKAWLSEDETLPELCRYLGRTVIGHGKHGSRQRLISESHALMTQLAEHRNAVVSAIDDLFNVVLRVAFGFGIGGGSAPLRFVFRDVFFVLRGVSSLLIVLVVLLESFVYHFVLILAFRC